MVHLGNLVLDFGGVVLDLHPERSSQAFQALLPEGEVLETYWPEAMRHIMDYEAGRLETPDFFHRLKVLMGKDTSIADLQHAWNLMLGELPPHRAELLCKVRRHYHCYLLSNSNGAHYDRYTEDLRLAYGPEGLAGLFDGLVFSFQEGCLKPGPEIYRILMHRFALDPSASVFIDDRLENVEGARQVGMKAIWLKEGMELASLFTEEGRLKGI
ncbi:MAG TPA: HAD family phosphatase [Bacteroidales bacterium]|nr:HAD family phosphatase [Bacteroidales bacterium]HRZ77727.1 HAD family phosphatase [Bacteroidales bacterium]